MPISVKCPECDAPYKVPDEAAGKAIKCKKCGAKVPIPTPSGGGGGDDDFANLGGGSSGGETKEKKKGGSGKTLLIVGIIVVLLTCCICVPAGGTAAWYFLWKGVEGAVKDAVKQDKIIIKENVPKDFGKDIDKLFKDDPFKDAFKDATKKGGKGAFLLRKGPAVRPEIHVSNLPQLGVAGPLLVRFGRSQRLEILQTLAT